MPEIKSQIAPEQAAAFLTEITRGWGDLSEPAMLELRCLFPGRTPNIARFTPDASGIEMAVEHAQAMNQHGLNIYPVINPVKADLPPNQAATDADVLASFFFWADGDDEDATYAIRNFAGPQYTMAVTTGRTPFPRPHIYWRIEDGPVTDLAEWTRIQRGIAAQLSTDKTVVNPSRIMRLPGMVNWPTEQKERKGRIPEIATFKSVYDEPRAPVPFERMQRIFAGSADAAPSEKNFTVDTGSFETLDRERTRIQALSGAEWHNAMIRLVASYVSRGLSDDEIHGLTDPLTLPGYTVDDTRREVQTAIDGARRKGWTPEVDAEVTREITPEEAEAIPAAAFRPWVQIDLASIPYPEFVYSDFYAKGYTSLTLAAPKVGKSMLGLAEALDMATGRGFLSGQEGEPLRVVYYNAEDDQNVINARVSALLECYGIEQSEIIGRFWPTSGVDAENFYLVTGQDGIINEPLFISLEKFCAQNSVDVLIFDPLQDLSASPETNEVFRLLGQRLRRLASKCNVSLGIIHHTRKVAPGMQATIDDGRGGSALRGTARFNRILNPMTEDEAAKAGVENHRFYFRIGDMESNLAPPSSDVNRWFEKVSVMTQAGREIGAVRAWKWPDAFSGITPQQAAHIRNLVDSMAEPPRLDVRSKSWVGEVVADALGMNLEEKSKKERVKLLVSGWIKSDVLRVAEAEDKRAGRTVNVVIAGANNPLVEGGQGA